MLRQALKNTATYRVRFDRKGLEEALGHEGLKAVMPHLPETQSKQGFFRRSEMHEEPFNQTKTDVILRLLSFELENRPDLAINHLESIELLDQESQLILGAYDRITSVCFTLPEEARVDLLNKLQVNEIPVEIIDKVRQ